MLPPRKQKKTKPKRSKGLRHSLLALAIVSGGAIAFAGYGIYKVDHALELMSSGSKAQATSVDKQAEAALQKPMSFLLAGVDSRSGSGGSMNSDVLMLVSLNPKTRSATVVSIPRDLELKPKALGLSSQKANYYYAYYNNQNKDTALEKTKQLFSTMFNVPLNYMAVIDFDGFREVVDELGGLEVDVDMDMRYVDTVDGTNINLKQGLQKLDGKQALDYLRYRKSNRGTAESSDTARNERQQVVLDKLLQKMTSLSGITQLGGVLEIAGRNVQTDIPADTLRRFLLNFRSLKPEQIQFIHLNGRWDSPYVVPKEEDLAAAVAALRSRLELTETSSSTVTKATYGSWQTKFGIDPASGTKR
ncbi:LCP family protein [Paenibacillus sp. YYML68]|uniref:LCP family protein n=1 Tax=Paenibacillus sp. YYML68 TaxID=2909250 RepID=UPI002493A84D|nr:LCP family protein [Paenibacillus sp. YYML68]